MEGVREIIRGNTYEGRVTADSFGADDTVTLYVVSGGHKLTIDMDHDEGYEFTWALSRSDTQELIGEIGDWEVTAESTDKYSTISKGTFDVVASLGNDADVFTSFNETLLGYIDEMLLARGTDPNLSFSVGDQSFSFQSREELYAFRSSLIIEVDRERKARKSGARIDNHYRGPSTFRVRF